MASVRDHYRKLLGQHYHHLAPSIDEAKAWLLSQGISQGGGTSQAIDLGSGTGVFTAALAGLGYEAVGIDTCSALVSKARGDFPKLSFSETDILAFEPSEPVHVCLLLGDTIRHLPSLTAVQSLIMTFSRHIAPGGLWLTTFRAAGALQGQVGFVDAVASDEITITSAIEQDGDFERVTDLVRTKAEGWRLQKSSYRKLIITAAMLDELFSSQGFAVSVRQAPHGETAVLATKR